MSGKSSKPDLVTLPIARTKNLVIQNVNDELLVYDMEADRAHHLNESLSIVWRACNAEMSVGELCKRLSNHLGLQIEEDFVHLAVSELNSIELLEDPSESKPISKVSRREVLFKYALPSVALPVVASLVAPSAVNAQSCVPNFQPCTVPADCCSNNCNTVVLIAPNTCDFPIP